MSTQKTVFGSLENYQKGGVEVIDDSPKNYAFSNVFEVASKSKPYEKVAVGKNLKYVIEALRAEGTSPWFAAAHDEAALVMDGEIEVHYVKPDQPAVADHIDLETFEHEVVRHHLGQVLLVLDDQDPLDHER